MVCASTLSFLDRKNCAIQEQSIIIIIITIILISDDFFSIVSLYANLAHSSDMLRNTGTSMGKNWDRTEAGKSLAQVIKSQVNI